MTDHHLRDIDHQSWPRIATVPRTWPVSMAARGTEAGFAHACAKAGIELDPRSRPDLVVLHAATFHRVAADGWLGLAEAYMAGEWTAPDLADVLARLLSVNYHPRGVHRFPGRIAGPPDQPDIRRCLNELSSPIGLATSGAVFESGVPTTLRRGVDKRSAASATGRYVDRTVVAPPVAVERADLPAAQLNGLRTLADAAGLAPGDQAAVLPELDIALAAELADRGVHVNGWVRNLQERNRLRAELAVTGTDLDAISVGVDPDLLAGQLHLSRGAYQAIVSLEALENLSRPHRTQLGRLLGHGVAPGGAAAIQTTVAGPAWSRSARAATAALRAYLWPHLTYRSLAATQAELEATTAMPMTAERLLGDHAVTALRMQREYFSGHSREAAAAGVDVVCRRLWRFQLALKEALGAQQMTTTVQLTFTQRVRRGR
ncbi:SAM-dependent methyltransferase [Corynebacterium sp. c6VSa_13]|nr:SAM-dependent methyltransferase [Corynebacterium sp. c6VSa_13]